MDSTMLGGVLGGAGEGAAVGAGVGSAFGPIGTAVGGVGGALVGGFLGWQSAEKRERDLNSANSRLQAIPEVDPSSMAYLDDLRRHKRAIEAGTAPEYLAVKDLTMKANAAGMNALTSLSGGATDVLFSAVNQLNNGTNMNINKLLGTTGQEVGPYMTQIGQLINEISQRKLDVQTFKTEQQLAQATQNMADFHSNMNMFMMRGLGQLSNVKWTDIMNQFKSGSNLNNTMDKGLEETGDAGIAPVGLGEYNSGVASPWPNTAFYLEPYRIMR